MIHRFFGLSDSMLELEFTLRILVEFNSRGPLIHPRYHIPRHL